MNLFKSDCMSSEVYLWNLIIPVSLVMRFNYNTWLDIVNEDCMKEMKWHIWGLKFACILLVIATGIFAYWLYHFLVNHN